MKSGNLNFLEPSGPLQACNGTALPYIQSNLITISISEVKVHPSTGPEGEYRYRSTHSLTPALDGVGGQH